MYSLLLVVVLSGCANLESPVVPEPVREIELQYAQDWPREAYDRKSTVNPCDVRLWFNIATLAEVLIRDPHSIPARSGSRYRSRSNEHLRYDIQLITLSSPERKLQHLVSVETFKCTDEGHLNACISAANEYESHSTDSMVVVSQEFLKSRSGVTSWLVGLRIVVAAVYPNSTVHVSDQYSTYLQ